MGMKYFALFLYIYISTRSLNNPEKQICSVPQRRQDLTTSWKCTTQKAAWWTSPPSWKPTPRSRTTAWRWWRRIWRVSRLTSEMFPSEHLYFSAAKTNAFDVLEALRSKTSGATCFGSANTYPTANICNCKNPSKFGLVCSYLGARMPTQIDTMEDRQVCCLEMTSWGSRARGAHYRLLSASSGWITWRAKWSRTWERPRTSSANWIVKWSPLRGSWRSVGRMAKTRPDSLLRNLGAYFMVSLNDFFSFVPECGAPQLDGSVSGRRWPTSCQVLTKTQNTSAEHGGGAPTSPQEVPQHEVASCHLFFGLISGPKIKTSSVITEFFVFFLKMHVSFFF